MGVGPTIQSKSNYFINNFALKTSLIAIITGS